MVLRRKCGRAHVAWFRNRYECYRCSESWNDEWSCACDDDCPHCGARHASPVDSEDLTFTIEDEGHYFSVWKSADEAEHEPSYREVIRFLSRDLGEAYISAEPSEGLV